MIFSAYLLVTLHAEQFKDDAANAQSVGSTRNPLFMQHLHWERGPTWKSALNNLRLLLQPYLCWSALVKWLEILLIPGLKRGLLKLMHKSNHFRIVPLLQVQAA